MGREFKPGDVAKVQYRGREVQATFYDTGAERGWYHGAGCTSEHYIGTVSDLDARPLVTIDPEDREQVERLLKAYHAQYSMDWPGDADEIHARNLQAALREFADPKPPKPDEPTGLGAVVEDDRGVRWVRTESAKGIQNPWQAALHAEEPDVVRSLRWVDVQAVRVLSEGVTS